jgi:nucleoid-associated protein EbfC
MFDMMKMLGKMNELKTKMAEAQERLADIVAEGEAGGGMVRAKVNGKKQVISLEIDKDLARPEDLEMLQDLTVAALNKALDAAEAQAKIFLQKQTEGLLPNIPGLDLNNLMQGQ